MDFNFMPNVNCPFCKKTFPIALSGFGGKINLRIKECKYCKKEFTVIIGVITSPIISELEHKNENSIKKRIAWLRKKRKENLIKLLIEHELCNKLYEESLETAREMRNNSIDN